MDISFIKTENPNAEQWKLLLQYSYLTNIHKFLEERGSTSDERTVNYIAGCIQQSEQYFHAFKSSSLDISPLLLYYGLTNLLAGASALLTGHILKIDEHGLVTLKSDKRLSRIGDLLIKPVNSASGALQQFANVFSDHCPLVPNSDKWSLIEILSSIPDLKNDFSNCYKDFPPFTVPTEVIRKPKFSFERIDPKEVQARPEFIKNINKDILNFDQAYHEPQISQQMSRIALYRKINGPDIGVYSIFGQKHLQIAHQKQSKLLSPSQLILMFMGLYTLGFVSRYNPDIWNPFVRNDITGERLVIE